MQKKDGTVLVQVFDDISDKKLFPTITKGIKGKNSIILDFAPLVKQGLLAFKVMVGGGGDLQEYSVRFKGN